MLLTGERRIKQHSCGRQLRKMDILRFTCTEKNDGGKKAECTFNLTHLIRLISPFFFMLFPEKSSASR